MRFGISAVQRYGFFPNLFPVPQGYLSGISELGSGLPKAGWRNRRMRGHSVRNEAFSGGVRQQTELLIDCTASACQTIPDVRPWTGWKFLPFAFECVRLEKRPPLQVISIRCGWPAVGCGETARCAEYLLRRVRVLSLRHGWEALHTRQPSGILRPPYRSGQQTNRRS